MAAAADRSKRYFEYNQFCLFVDGQHKQLTMKAAVVALVDMFEIFCVVRRMKNFLDGD
jgi:hypothetical protein